MYFIGLNIEKVDASATLFFKNKLICHVEEERFARIKKAFGLFPSKSLMYCINQIPNKLDGLSKIIVGLDLNKIKKELPKKYIEEAKLYPNKQTLVSSFYQQQRIQSKDLKNVKKEIKNSIVRNGFADPKNFEVAWFEHHYCHALSAHLTSPFEKSLGIVADGDAEIDCVSIFDCNGTDVKKIYTKELPHSLGWYYKALTIFCGFDRYEGQGMFMGLAPYGKPNKTIRKKLEKILIWENDSKGNFDYTIDPKYIYLGERFSKNKHLTKKLINLFGNPCTDSFNPDQYYKDIAYEAQDRLEKTLNKLFDRFLIQTGHENVTLSGGVFLNCKATGYIWKNNKKIKDIYTVPFSGDDGIGVGACQAFSIKNKISLKKNDYKIKNIFLGPEYNNKEIKNELNNFKINQNFKNKKQFDALCKTLNLKKKTLNKIIDKDGLNQMISKFISNNLIYLSDITSVCSELLKKNNIIAFFQGRMEAGPRALGNRSVLASPMNKSIINTLNKKVKFRQPWRPFCPVVLDEFKDEYFVKTTESHYMINTFEVTEKCKSKAPAIVHVDGTARTQFLVKDTHPLLHSLISNFYKITDVPILINTSLNIKGEPMCMSPNDAINFFFKTEIDFLSIGNYLLGKHKSNACL